MIKRFVSRGLWAVVASIALGEAALAHPGHEAGAGAWASHLNAATAWSSLIPVVLATLFGLWLARRVSRG